MGIKVCPHCGASMFAAEIIRGAVVQSTENGFNILKENRDKTKYDLKIVMCGRCRKEVKESELIEGVKCSCCGNFVSESEIIDGKCEVCRAKENDPEIANASEEDLIRMALDLKKQIAMLKAGNTDTPVASSEPVKEALAEESEEVQAEEEKPIEKKKKRVSRKKTVKEESSDEEEQIKEDNTPEEVKDEEKEPESVQEEKEDTADTVTEETAEQEAASEEVDSLADSQEAPFPDIEFDLGTGMALPIAEEKQEEKVSDGTAIDVASFEMFKQDDEAF